MMYRHFEHCEAMEKASPLRALLRTIGMTLVLMAVFLPAEAIVFRRDILTIIPKPEIRLNEQGQPLPEQPAPRAPIRFYTELRDEQALKLDWVHSLNRINAERTMTILFDPPRYDLIIAQNTYQPIDIISISPEGIITQIVPNLVLAALSSPIESSTPTRARLIVAGGAAEILGLQIGDRVEHPAFKAAPKVMRE
jgi:uncharacterized membrane protein (UPF0127 family)